MNANDFGKELNKYPKELIIASLSEHHFLFESAKLEIIQRCRKKQFDILMKQSEQIGEEMKELNLSNIQQRIKYIKLFEKDRAIHKKINKLLGIEV